MWIVKVIPYLPVAKMEYEATGSPVVELYDHGRSHYVTQNFRVLLYGSFQDTDTVRAGYYISPATGNVTLLSI